MPFDVNNPFKAKQWTREQLAELFGKTADTRKTMALRKSNKPMYDAMRSEAQDYDLIPQDGPDIYDRTPGAKRPVDTTRQVPPDAETLRAVAKFSRERCLKLARKKGDDPGESMHSISQDPLARREMTIAMRFHNVLPQSTNVPPAPVAKPAPVDPNAGTLALTSEQCRILNQPIGSRIARGDLPYTLSLVAGLRAKQDAHESVNDNPPSETPDAE